MKILFVSTISDSMIFVEKQIELLLDKGHTVGIACRVSKQISDSLMNRGVEIHNVQFSRNPIDIKNIKAFLSLKKIIDSSDYLVVHTLTPIASAAVRAIKIWNKKIVVIYTAHGFHFYSGAPLKNWLFFYPIEKLLSYVTDFLITINEEDYQFAKNYLRTKGNKVFHVHGAGFRENTFIADNFERSKKRDELMIPQDSKVLVSIGELNGNKNHSLVIRALGHISDPNVHYVICGEGHLFESLRSLSKALNIEKRVHLLGYRKDIFEILDVSDIFILPSKREGLPVALMEAMSMGLPVICSNIRGNRDLIQDGKGGLLFDTNDSASFESVLLKMLKADSKCMGYHNIRAIKNFELNWVIQEMSTIYEDAVEKANSLNMVK